MGKFDLKSAYRRAPDYTAAALESMTQFNGMLFIALR
jgi:hypothetical protein